MSRIAEEVRRLAEPVAAQLELSVWDVEFVKEAGARYLRIYIDKESGVGIDDCERFSRAMDAVLDEADPIEESYCFEVSSPGVERVLRRPEHFGACLGRPVEVRLYSAVGGQKTWTGTLAGYDAGAVTLTADDGSTVTFEKAQVAKVNLRMI